MPSIPAVPVMPAWASRSTEWRSSWAELLHRHPGASGLHGQEHGPAATAVRSLPDALF
ncbi:hypothetical protein [Streptomyces platensis]|uniref:hypothetical protein n=1 Tax=Streptomyces platensis TaxID=58346 RepID=UPI001F465933|nr:hypothetical protein [Streptomyces platensis]MCF3146876.1 hypothetical protein [Streptomyces platensis]